MKGLCWSFFFFFFSNAKHFEMHLVYKKINANQTGPCGRIDYDVISCLVVFFKVKLEHAQTRTLHHWNRLSHLSSGFILEVLICDSRRLTVGFVVRWSYLAVLVWKSSFSRFYFLVTFAKRTLFKGDLVWQSYWECILVDVACADSEVWRGEDATRERIQTWLQTDGRGGESTPPCGLGSWSSHNKELFDSK